MVNGVRRPSQRAERAPAFANTIRKLLGYAPTKSLSYNGKSCLSRQPLIYKASNGELLSASELFT